MSETEHIAGKLVPVHLNKTIREAMRIILEEYGEYDDTEGLVDQFEDIAYRKYIVHDNVMYLVVGAQVEDEQNIAKASLNDDGSINFEVRWYNGGASFGEIVEQALDKLGDDYAY